MKVYNVIINDRHEEPVIYNFCIKQNAVDFAKQKVKQFDYPKEDIEEQQWNPEKEDGWMISWQLGEEGDYVRVSEGELK